MRFIRTQEVLDMIGVGRTTLWEMVRDGSFPWPVRITERISAYQLEAVEQWMRLRAEGLAWPPTGKTTGSGARTGRGNIALARGLGASQGASR